METEIVELVECRISDANFYLKSGYKYLGYQGITSSSTHKDGTSYVRRGFVYILGRGKDTQHQNPPVRPMYASK